MKKNHYIHTNQTFKFKYFLSLFILFFFAPIPSHAYSFDNVAEISSCDWSQDETVIELTIALELQFIFDVPEESEVETEIESESGLIQLIFFEDFNFFLPQFIFRSSKILGFTKAEFSTIDRVPYYKLFCHWKTHLN